MIDLTPLDVRKKRDDFRKILRGYDPDDVDTFLELVAERMEELVKENLTLRERTERLQEQVSSQLGRERAVQEALVTAQELRDDIRGQARQEADDVLGRAEKEAALLRKQAEADAEEILARARRRVEERGEALKELERKRLRFLRAFRSLLERELDVVEVEEGRAPLDDTAVELDFGPGPAPREERSARPPPLPAPTGAGGSSASTEGEGSSPSTPPDDGLEGPLSVEPLQADASGNPPPSPADDLAAPSAHAPFEADASAADAPQADAPEADARAAPGDGPTDGELSDDPAARDDTPPADDLPSPADAEEDDPKRWLSSLVERELNEKGDEDPWG